MSQKTKPSNEHLRLVQALEVELNYRLRFHTTKDGVLTLGAKGKGSEKYSKLVQAQEVELDYGSCSWKPGSYCCCCKKDRVLVEEELFK